jgi:ribonuclease HII
VSKEILLSSLPHLEKEIALQMQGYCFVAGLDEAGRGAWAGPVVAAVVILPVDQPDLTEILSGLNDSKKLSIKRRNFYFDLIQEISLAVATGSAGSETVDSLNVVGATRQAMAQAINNLASAPDYLLLDHLRLPDVEIPQQAFARADSISLTVAAASVIAKVTRDRLMVNLHREFPVYGFDRHKGYGTALHRAALKKYGPCAIHRQSYEPVRVATTRVPASNVPAEPPATVTPR